MVSLANVGMRFDSEYQRSDGLKFVGSILPADEGNVPTADFTYERLLLRVPVDSPLKTKDIMFDVYGRRFLLMDHGIGQMYSQTLYRTHRLAQLTAEVSWTRMQTVTDTLTNLKKSTTPTELGPIWVALEPFGREPLDLTLRVKEQIRRLITGSPVQLGDLIDGQVVKRLDPMLGVWLAEVQ